MMGEFTKGRRAGVHFDTAKPFEIDAVEGVVRPRCMGFFKRNVFFDEWFFIENHRISEIKDDPCLRSVIESVWKEWCEKHRRKHHVLFEPKKTR